MGALVSSLSCTAFNVVRDVWLMPKPLLVSEAPKKHKKPPRSGTKPQKEAKLKSAAERPAKGWFTQGKCRGQVGQDLESGHVDRDVAPRAVRLLRRAPTRGQLADPTAPALQSRQKSVFLI